MVILLAGIGLMLGCLTSCDTRKDRQLVKGPFDPWPRWAKDGSALYYGVKQSIWRYDPVTRRRTQFRMPIKYEKFDISPDGTHAVLQYPNFPKITVVDLQSQAVTIPYTFTPIISTDTGYESVQNSIEEVFWLTNERILFAKREAGGNAFTGGAYTVNRDGSGLTRILPVYPRLIYCAHDGSGFVYTTPGNRWHYYALATRQDRVLDVGGSKPANIDLLPKYLSKDYWIYWKTDIADYSVSVEMYSLATDQRQTSQLPENLLMQELSPDLRWMYYIDAGDWQGREKGRLYIMPIPAEMRAAVVGDSGT